MQVNKSEYVFQKLNTHSDINDLLITDHSANIIAYISEFIQDFDFDKINGKNFTAVFINWVDSPVKKMDFSFIEKSPVNLPVFLLLSQKIEMNPNIHLTDGQDVTILYCIDEIDPLAMQTWVANVLENRLHFFAHSKENEQHRSDELILGLDANGRIIFCSEETCQYLGAPAAQVLTNDIYQWIGSELKIQQAKKRIGKLNSGSKKEKHKQQILPIIGKDRRTLFLIAYKNYIDDKRKQSLVLLHAQNNREQIIDKYNDVKKQYYGLFELFQDAILIIDLYGYILYINDTFTQLFGYSIKEIQTSGATILFSSPEQYEQSRQQLLARQKIQLATFKKSDGTIFEGEVSYSIFHDKKGKDRGFFLLFRDISERKQLLEEKQKIQERLKHTQEIARLAYWRYDFDEGMFEFSDELYKILDVPKIRKMVDANTLLSDWIYIEDKKAVLEFFNKVKDGKLPPGIEFRIQPKNEIDYVYMEASDLMTDDQGKIVQVEGILQDISRRKRAEIKSLRREIQIKSFINDMDGGYARFAIVANEEGVFDDAVLLETNDNFEKLLGVPPNAVIGKTFKSFFGHINPGVLQTGIEVAQTGQSKEIHNDIFDERHWFDLKIHQSAEGEFVISFYDVTEREKESIKIRRQNKYLLALQETTRDLLTLSDSNTLLQNIIDRASELVDSENGFLDFMEPGGTSRYPRVVKGELVKAISFPVKRGIGLTGTVWETGKPLLIENYDEWENRIPDFNTEYISSIVGVPIISNNEVIGVMVLAKEFGASEIYTEADIDILTQFARLATLAIENSQLLSKLQKEIADRKLIEERLRKSEENYRALFENVPDGLYRTNLKGDILAVNPALITLLGYSSFQELIKNKAVDFYVDINERNAFISAFDQQTDIHSAELHLRRKDGSILYVIENGRAIRDSERNIVYFEGTITDITELKKAHQLLEKQSNELSRLYKASESLFYDQSTNLENLAKTIVNSVSNEFNQVNCSLFIFDETENALRLLALTEFEGNCKNVIYLPVQGKGVITRSVRERSVMNIPDVSKDDDYLINWDSSCSELCIPLLIHEQILGVLNIESAECDAFDDDDVRLLSIFAEKAAFSLQQTINTIKEQRRFEKLLQIQKLGTELSLLHDEKSILDTMLRYLQSISPHSNCIVLIFDYLQNGYRIAAHAGFVDSYRPNRQEIIFNKDLIYHLQQNNIYYSGDLEKVMPSIREVFPESSDEQFVSFTLTNEGEVFGSILLTGEFASSKEDDAIIEVLAKIVSAALTNARLFEATNLTLERLASLRRIDLAIASSTDITFMIDVLLEQLTNQLHVDAADVLLYSPAGHVFNYCSGTGIHTQKFIQSNVRLGEGLTGKTAFNRETIIIKDLSDQTDLDRRLQYMADDGYVGYIGIPIIAKGVIKGFLEVFQTDVLLTPKDWMDYLEIISGQAAIAIETIDLFSNLQRSNTDLSLAYDSTLEGWASALELRDKETEGHTRRVAEMTIDLAISMDVKPDDLKTMRWGALLHDIGKMGIPDDILLKPGTLTEDEWLVMRKHPVYAFELLSKIDYLRHALDIPYCHHEKWDGTGYPRQLQGEAIPLSARIFAITDVWDALTSNRPYRKAWSEEKAMDYIVEQSGTHFDPRVVEHFQKIMKTRINH